MPFADFCLITPRLTSLCAIGFHHIRFFELMKLKDQGTCIPEPDWLSTVRSLSRSPQTRARTFPALLHHLRWPLSHMASLSLAISPPAYASYDVLVYQLAVLRPASFRLCLAV
jgi:hypothetical protein